MCFEYLKHHNIDFFLFSFQPDVTVVIENYSAANNSEITVLKGQQVEVIDPTPGEPNWCMVRAINCEDGEPCQGLVPIASLKPIPMLRGPGNRNSMDIDGRLFSNLMMVNFTPISFMYQPFG